MKTRYMCPTCRDSEYSPITYSHSEHKPVCANCGTPFCDFIENKNSLK